MNNLIFLLCVFIFPFANIWSINILFITEIPYTIETWLASAVLSSLITRTAGTKR